MRTAIVKDFEVIVNSMRDPLSDKPNIPYYEYGHRLEIANLLTEKEKTQFKYTKYPLIALRLDIAEDIDEGMAKVNLNMAILTMTDANYSAKQRYDNVIIPVLYPLYDRFFKAIKKSGIFTWEGHLLFPPHTAIDRPYWGTQYLEGNLKNIFNDPLDAIEIIDLKLNKRLKC